MFSVIEHVPRLESLALLPGAATSLMNTHVAAFIGSCRKSVALVSHLRDRSPGARHEHRKFIGQFFTADTQKRRWFVIEILDSVALVMSGDRGSHAVRESRTAPCAGKRTAFAQRRYKSYGLAARPSRARAVATAI